MSVGTNTVNRNTADFAGAAQALVDGCVDLSSDEERVALLRCVCTGLGDELYPSFVQVLWLVGRFGDHGAREIVARTLVHALRTGRLPSGRRGAWGASYGSARSLGPIEYLCAWYAQEATERALSAEQFHAGAGAVMDLVAASREARALYCEKLLADVDDPIGGMLTRSTRAALRALATTWGQGAAPTDATACFVNEIDRSRAGTVNSIALQIARTGGAV
jgi:hypothetical protein